MTIFTCKHCNYFSDRKYNLQKHINNKHAHVLLKNDNVKNVQNDIPKIQNDIPKIQNDIPKIQNDIPKIQNDIPCEFYCKKCNKMYKTARHLKTHESKCNKVDSLTCPKYMISFTHRNNKNRHIKENKCKARSIIHAPDLRTFNILPTMVQSRMQ
jgi:hypothetical protein